MMTRNDRQPQACGTCNTAFLLVGLSKAETAAGSFCGYTAGDANAMEAVALTTASAIINAAAIQGKQLVCILLNHPRTFNSLDESSTHLLSPWHLRAVIVGTHVAMKAPCLLRNPFTFAAFRCSTLSALVLEASRRTESGRGTSSTAKGEPTCVAHTYASGLRMCVVPLLCI